MQIISFKKVVSLTGLEPAHYYIESVVPYSNLATATFSDPDGIRTRLSYETTLKEWRLDLYRPQGP